MTVIKNMTPQGKIDALLSATNLWSSGAFNDGVPPGVELRTYDGTEHTAGKTPRVVRGRVVDAAFRDGTSSIGLVFRTFGDPVSTWYPASVLHSIKGPDRTIGGD